MAKGRKIPLESKTHIPCSYSFFLFLYINCFSCLSHLLLTTNGVRLCLIFYLCTLCRCSFWNSFPFLLSIPHFRTFKLTLKPGDVISISHLSFYLKNITKRAFSHTFNSKSDFSKSSIIKI